MRPSSVRVTLQPPLGGLEDAEELADGGSGPGTDAAFRNRVG